MSIMQFSEQTFPIAVYFDSHLASVDFILICIIKRRKQIDYEEKEK